MRMNKIPRQIKDLVPAVLHTLFNTSSLLTGTFSGNFNKLLSRLKLVTLGTAKLFMGMTGNDVTVNIKGGATCNNS